MIDLMKPIRRIHTTIDEDDYVYMKKHHLRAAHLIRAMVRDHRVHIEDPDANPTAREQNEKLQKAMSRINNIFKVMGKCLPPKKFEEILQKI